MTDAAREQAIEAVLAAARLARLELSSVRAALLAPQFARILQAFGSLAALAPRAAEAESGPAEARDVTRADVAQPGLAREAFLAAAPEHTAEHLRVPRAVGRDA
jgi:aspartyl/glutamyl-tRNA(Asn/Gln) amidotransferase C subunit